MIKTGWPAPELMQDDHRGLFKWFASKPDSRRLVRAAAEEIKMKKYVSEWHKEMKDFHFPEGMPQELREKVIRLRRQVMAYGYILFGLDQEIIGDRLWTRLCKQLEDIQAAWGWDFGFYDFVFVDWDQTQEDHLITNSGIDGPLTVHAMNILAARKKYERKHQLGEPA